MSLLTCSKQVKNDTSSFKFQITNSVSVKDMPVISSCIIRPESGLERQVKEIMHKAFWEILREELESDPPQYKQVCKIISRIMHK
jgi:T-complex protein 11